MVPKQMAETSAKTSSASGSPTLAKAPGSASRPAPNRPVCCGGFGRWHDRFEA